ncbi:signal peptidase II [Tetragenococcus muriaticus]|uniref:Lipoprotein signal peptidase n=1 Tax=Tetragenococcus muriaticus 3MR10-3 TaxID=1302648 RepID=A0A091BZN1_9ENTE|nr:signal peptidase II [Tetragenococcus muriaticus]KFN91066.1 lipoprotein signal peptidase [Tetragenococcus muriaticus 3MR10-3]GMA47168.1 lipoprotein signal peptidase [Tetragenococcus muriaticus]
MLIIIFLLSLLVIGIDQWVKFWTVTNLEIGETQSLLDPLFSLTYVQNQGAAWNILEGQMTFFTLITVIAVVVVTYLIFRYRKESKFLTIGLALVLAGAVGNFIDRIRLGYVVDMIQADFIQFPIFNIADSSLVIGVILIFIYTIFEDRLKGKEHGGESGNYNNK